MARILNIGTLDVREIKKELAEDITSIENVGILIESDQSQVLLKNARKTNIGTTIKLPEDLKIDVVMKNGKLTIDKEYLEGITSLVVLLVNGELIFEDDVDIKSLEEKIYRILLNGSLICPKNLVGFLETRGTINGSLSSYSSGYKYIGKSLELTNRFLKNLKPGSKISTNKLILIDKIDGELLGEKISNMEILNKLIIVDEYEDMISPYVKDYYKVETISIPNSENGVKYVGGKISIDDSSLKAYNRNALYVDGTVEIYLKEAVVFNEYIENLICKKVICDEQTHEMIKDSLYGDIKVQIIRGKLIENLGKMVLSGSLEGEITIENKGKLVFEEDISIEDVKENLISIINYGLVQAPEHILDIVRNKTKENYGKIGAKKSAEDKAKESYEDAQKEDIKYSNIGELKL